LPAATRIADDRHMGHADLLRERIDGRLGQ
jgi:hypothetical protein